MSRFPFAIYTLELMNLVIPAGDGIVMRALMVNKPRNNPHRIQAVQFVAVRVEATCTGALKPSLGATLPKSTLTAIELTPGRIFGEGTDESADRPQLWPRKIPLPGPSGRSRKYQTASSVAHASQNGMTNGNIREITVPRPAFGS